ncbi:MAG: segregation/condensation protein A [Methanomicrobiales archaeon]|nr:segregation/condensation protein A [Methanomicrobiales archaeon]
MPEEPVEILVSMAERGEIDPWNIDIVEVTDRFLSELERLRELDLRISGRTLFFAATLLRMKSEYLLEAELDAADTGFSEDLDEFTDDFGIDGNFDFGDVAEPIERLEREIQRRIGRKKQRARPVTLYELIKQLKTAEKEERRRHRRRAAAPVFLIEADDVVGIAHEEDFQDAASSVLSSFEEAERTHGRVTLSDLCSAMACGVREVYIPLLFLMIEGKLQLTQEEFFGEILISRSPDSSVAGDNAD